MSFNQYDEIIFAASVGYNVSVPLIKSVIMTESSFNPNAYRPEPAISDGSYGLMQLLFRTAVGLGFPNDPAQHARLFDPAVNIDLGTHLLSQLQGRYGGNVADIYAAYNSGAVRKNAAGQYVNSTGDTAVNARVNRFLSIYASFYAEWQATATPAVPVDDSGDEGATPPPADGGAGDGGAVDPLAVAALVVVALLGYLAYKWYL